MFINIHVNIISMRTNALILAYTSHGSYWAIDAVKHPDTKQRTYYQQYYRSSGKAVHWIAYLDNHSQE